MGERFTGRMAAAFVLAFLCLNAAGALCLSYCAGMMATSASASAKGDATESDSHLSEHCKAMKREAADADSERTKAAAIEPACCMMPVAMLAVPVERSVKFDTSDAPVAMPASVEFAYTPVSANHFNSIQQPVYRPPPLDRRTKRQLNCVIRI